MKINEMICYDMICITWYVNIFSFKRIEINIEIFIYNLNFLWKKKLQAEIAHNVITLRRNKALINISNYAYHQVTKGTTLKLSNEWA
jgi:hypothetical protein